MPALRANSLRAGVLLVLGLVASNLYAQTLTTLASFNGSNGDISTCRCDAQRQHPIWDDRSRRHLGTARSSAFP